MSSRCNVLPVADHFWIIQSTSVDKRLDKLLNKRVNISDVAKSLHLNFVLLLSQLVRRHGWDILVIVKWIRNSPAVEDKSIMLTWRNGRKCRTYRITDLPDLIQKWIQSFCLYFENRIQFWLRLTHRVLIEKLSLIHTFFQCEVICI